MSKAKILIVEDEVLIANNLKRDLEKKGYDIASFAVSGEKALLIAEKEKPDLVLMDIVLKGDSDGIITADQIQKQFGIPVIFISAYSDEFFTGKSISNSFVFFKKPYDIEELCVGIESALKKSKFEK